MICEESDTYQYILEQGQLKGGRRILLLLGRERFGEADANVRTTLEKIIDLDLLERMCDRLLEASTWQELLETP